MIVISLKPLGARILYTLLDFYVGFIRERKITTLLGDVDIYISLWENKDHAPCNLIGIMARPLIDADRRKPVVTLDAKPILQTR